MLLIKLRCCLRHLCTALGNGVCALLPGGMCCYPALHIYQKTSPLQPLLACIQAEGALSMTLTAPPLLSCAQTKVKKHSVGFYHSNSIIVC